MQKSVLLVCFVISFSMPCVAQIADLIQFEKRTKDKVQVGMTPDEVKQILGRPQAIKGGFPDSEDTIVEELPEQAGQLNNSTWFYFLPHMTISVDGPKNSRFLLHGFEVSEHIFKSYLGVDQIYLYKGKIVLAYVGRAYYLQNDTNLTIIKKDLKRMEERQLPRKQVPKTFRPVVAVVFDKGTQVVATKRVYFVALL